MWFYKQTEPGLFTVFYEDKNGELHSDSDHADRAKARDRVSELNGRNEKNETLTIGRTLTQGHFIPVVGPEDESLIKLDSDKRVAIMDLMPEGVESMTELDHIKGATVGYPAYWMEIEVKVRQVPEHVAEQLHRKLNELVNEDDFCDEEDVENEDTP